MCHAAECYRHLSPTEGRKYQTSNTLMTVLETKVYIIDNLQVVPKHKKV